MYKILTDFDGANLKILNQTESAAELSSILETPYFMVNGTMFTPERAIETGHCFIKALEKYDKQ